MEVQLVFGKAELLEQKLAQNTTFLVRYYGRPIVIHFERRRTINSC